MRNSEQNRLDQVTSAGCRKRVPGLIDLDHTMMRVPDLDTARTAWRALGFTVTPYRPNPSMGGGETGGRGGNHLIILTPQSPQTTNLIELAWADPDHATPDMKQCLSGPGGLAMLLHAASDIDVLRESWKAAGMTLSRDIEYEGDYHDPDTGQVDLISYRAFTIDPATWHYWLAAAQARDFAHYTRADWRTHPNSAQYFQRVTLTLASDEMAGARDLLTGLYGYPPEASDANIMEFTVGKLGVRLLTPAALASCYPEFDPDELRTCNTGLTIMVSDMTRLRREFEKSGIPAELRDGRVAVAPRWATGILIEFREISP